jgi:uncharacterized protein
VSVPPEIDLTQPQRDALHSVFVPFADRIDIVGVYGSRAQGRARRGSDVDLVVYGKVADADIARMRIDLDESDLSIFADVTAYDAIAHPRLREQIDQWMKPLFRRHDLVN